MCLEGKYIFVYPRQSLSMLGYTNISAEVTVALARYQIAMQDVKA